MFRQSDINGRLPRFREAKQSIRTTAQLGGFDGIPPNIPTYLDGMEPVGLNKRKEVILPRSYKPENGPPVLMLHPHEQSLTFTSKVTAAEMRSAQTIINQSGMNASLPSSVFNSKCQIDDYPSAQVTSNLIRLTSMTDPENPYPIFMPRLLVAGSTNVVSSDELGPAMTHEADHWDFSLNEIGRLQSDPSNRYTVEQLLAISEKRAYQTSYTIAKNLGHYAAMGSLDVLTERHSGIQPLDVQDMKNDFTNSCLEVGANRKVATHLSVLAITQLFGNPDKLVTDEEITALRTLKLI